MRTTARPRGRYGARPASSKLPEDMLTVTAMQAAVLGLMRREPPTPRGKISSELGIAKTAVTLAWHARTAAA